MLTDLFAIFSDGMKRKNPSTLPRLAQSVPHVTQLDNWDCGLACLSMILAGAHKSGLVEEDPTKTNPLCLRTLLAASGAGDSVWTIDLAYMIRHFGVDDFTFYTSYIGVNLQYGSKNFYKDCISSDRRRIHDMFAEAQDFGVRVVPVVLSLDDMKRFLLSESYAIVVLVNLKKLKSRTMAPRNPSSVVVPGKSVGGRRDSITLSAPVECAEDYKSYYSKYVGTPKSSSMPTSPTKPRSRCMEGLGSVFGCFSFGAKSSEDFVDAHIASGTTHQNYGSMSNPEMTPCLSSDASKGCPNGIGRVNKVLKVENETMPLLVNPDQPVTSLNESSTFLGTIFTWLVSSKETQPPTAEPMDTTPPTLKTDASASYLSSPGSSSLHSQNPSTSTIRQTASPDTSPASAHSTSSPVPKARSYLPTHDHGVPSILTPGLSPPHTPRRDSKMLGDTTPETQRPNVGRSPSKQPSTPYIFTPSITTDEAQQQAGSIWNPLSWMYGGSPTKDSQQPPQPRPDLESGASTATIQSQPSIPFRTEAISFPTQRPDSRPDGRSSSPRTIAIPGSMPSARRDSFSGSPRRPSTLSRSKPYSTDSGSIPAAGTRGRKGSLRSSGPAVAGSASAEGEEFMGHYILMIGYCPESDCFIYRDPGTEEALSVVDAAVFDGARAARGTDHDAIVVRVR
ncbi:hypothetical protein HDU97_009293 [Phlyctochytrium planicorne]|nr:hypothetical protein HDU97_009293 [Phlyctochytrium planicorne]